MTEFEELGTRAATLVDKLLSEGGDEPLLKELEDLLARLPESECAYARGVLAYARDRADEAVEHLCRAAAEECNARKEPPTCDEMWRQWGAPFAFDTQPTAWSRLAGVFGRRWRGSAACLLLEAYAARYNDDDKAAEKLLVKCLDVDGSYWAASSELGAICQERKDWRMAIAYHEHALAHANGDDKLEEYFHLGHCQLALGNRDSAARFYEEGVARSSKSWREEFGFDDKSDSSSQWGQACAYFLLGSDQEELEDVDGAIDSYAKALDAHQGFWMAATDLGWIYFDNKNWRAAQAYFEQAIAQMKDHPIPDGPDPEDIHSGLGLCCLEIKDYEGAADAFRESLELDPDYPYARNNLGWSLMKAGKLEEAVTVLREAMERGTQEKCVLRNLARALRKLKRYDEAIEVLQHDIYRGRLTKSASRRIAELQALLARQASGEAEQNTDESEANGDGPEEEEEDSGAEAGPEGTVPARRHSHPPVAGPAREQTEATSRISKEGDLESMLETLIDRGQAVFGRRLRMFQADDSRYSRYGRQFVIPDIGGRIDLLTVDVQTGELVVIELKRDKPERDTIGQVWEYVRWVQENVAKEGQQVRGIICVREATERLLLATRGLPGVGVFQYGLLFTEK